MAENVTAYTPYDSEGNRVPVACPVGMLYDESGYGAGDRKFASAAQGAKADAAMPKSGGTFSGAIAAPAITSSGDMRTYGNLFFGMGSENYGIQAYSASGHLRLWALAGASITDPQGSAAPISASNVSGSSSRRYKRNITDMSEDTTKLLLKLRPVSFEYNDDLHDHGTKYGLIAEELAEIDPTCVYRDSEGQIDGINYTMLVPQLIRLCQIQQKQIDDLNARVNALEGGAENA